MNLSQFLEHWAIIENPFQGEEARNDTVFARMGLAGPNAMPVGIGHGSGVGGGMGSGTGTMAGVAGHKPRASDVVVHSDFEKVLGDPARPSSAIVFGEKGSGKTAIRLQLEDRIANWNANHPHARVLLVPYDSLNPVLDAFCARVAGKKEPVEQTLAKLRLQDHIDAILSVIVPRVMDSLMGVASEASRLDLGETPKKTARRMELAQRWDLLRLQAIYDAPEEASARSGLLRWTLRLNHSLGEILWKVGALTGWIPAAGLAFWNYVLRLQADQQDLRWWIAGLAAPWLIPLAKVLVFDRMRRRALARKVRKQVRVLPRTEGSYASSLASLASRAFEGGLLPTGDSEDARYEAVQRLRRILSAYGYASMVIVIDRVDEPSVVSGSVEKMRAVVWPILNNKFLQQEGIGFKLLLPIELRHALFKESSSFFQEARLDKQHMIERLTWTGAMLYDLCDRRLKACLAPNTKSIGILDLFAEDVTRQDLVDALDQMRQPRDAFKLLYACLVEHCSNVTADQNAWRIPRSTLDMVRKLQSDRVQQLTQGIRPA